MEIKVMSWNIAGAKVLKKLNTEESSTNVASDYINEYNRVWRNAILGRGKNKMPDVILLQECIGFSDTRSPEEREIKWVDGAKILSEIFSGYETFFFASLSSISQPHPRRWDKMRKGKEEEYLPEYVEVKQGYGICIKKPELLKRLWPVMLPVSTEKQRKQEGKKEPVVKYDDHVGPSDYNLAFQAIPISTGLYLGTRDTEPRLAVLGRMKIENSNKYLNFLNLHLTTLNGEREGKIKVNRKASQIRLNQLDLVLDFIISAYQEAGSYRIHSGKTEDIWIIGGDFNATPESQEIELIKSVGFIDGNPNKQLNAPEIEHLDGKEGTKWSIRNEELPPTTLDYIFCGIEKASFTSGKIKVDRSLRPFRPGFKEKVFESDHAVLLAVFDIDSDK